MEQLNNTDPDGDILVNVWKKVEKESPDLAKTVIMLVDKGREHSLDYYAGFNDALVAMADIDPSLTLKEFYGCARNQFWAAAMGYTEYQRRNT